MSGEWFIQKLTPSDDSSFSFSPGCLSC